jgi:Uma2 family endonuclease
MTATATSPAPSRAAEPERVRRYPVVFMASDDPSYLASARMSFEEFLDLDWEHGFAEWVDGEVFLYMGVTDAHQRVVDFLTGYLGFIVSALGLGTLRTGPYPVRLPLEGPAREPDLYLIAKAHDARRTRRFFDGPPDLVIEVVSDDSPRRDGVVKFEEYERAGVPEYWVIDPRSGSESARFFVSEDGTYVEQAADADGVYTSRAFPDVKLRVAWLFEDPPPALPDALMFALGPDLGVSRRR